MKIAFASDLHNCASTNKAIVEFAKNVVYMAEPDVIVLGGDIGEARLGIGLIREVFEIFGSIRSRLFVVGNHDLWTDNPNRYTSRQLWEDLIPQIGGDLGWHYLEQSNWVQNGVAIVGSYLHYDYSAADSEGVVVRHIKTAFPGMSPDAYYEMMKKSLVNDANFFHGLPRDKVFAQQIGEQFQQRLLQAQNDPSVHSIIIATHVPCMPCQITRSPEDFHWSGSTAYFGNLAHTQCILDCSKVKFVLSGHSHQENVNIIPLNAEGHFAQVFCSGADYNKPKLQIIEI